MKILIIKTGAFGDMILSSAFFQTVKVNFPEDDVYLLTQEVYRETVEYSPLFKKIFYLPAGYKFFNFLHVIRGLRNLKLDIIFDAQGNLKTNFYCFLAGGEKRYGTYRKKIGRLFLTKGVRKRKKKKNAVDKPRPSILEFVGVKQYIKDLKLWIPEQKRKNFNEFIKNYNLDKEKRWITIHPLSAKEWPSKRWGKGKFAELADKLIEDGYEVILVGSGDSVYTDEIVARMRNKPKNLVNKTDFYNLSLILEKSLVLVTGDSGPLHVGAAAGTKVIGIFGPTNPLLHCPAGVHYIYKKVDCSPCYKKRCSDMRCMKKITVEDVYRKIKEIEK